MRLITLLLVLLLVGCSGLGGGAQQVLTQESVVVIPGSKTFEASKKLTIKELSTLLVNEITPIFKDQLEEQLEDQLEESQRMLKILLRASRKKKQVALDEITLFFEKGNSSLESSYTEPARLINFIDHMVRKSDGRKIFFVCIGHSSEIRGQKNDVVLALDRSKAPIRLIEKYLVNVPFEVVSTFAVAPRGNITESNADKYQNVQVIAAFNKEKLPTLPNS
ncbi:MAG: hypothetical protein KAG10_09790 [Methylococcales bacterium]|nr:hypothetical protein [Methylococcales bacterium]MCK5926173.1 hypothetical protein [Methylococcales bacterium]